MSHSKKKYKSLLKNNRIKEIRAANSTKVFNDGEREVAKINEKSLSVPEVVDAELKELNPVVHRLYSDTWHGIPTDPKYKEELMDPSVTFEDMVAATRLGTEKWIQTSKER